MQQGRATMVKIARTQVQAAARRKAAQAEAERQRKAIALQSAQQEEQGASFQDIYVLSGEGSARWQPLGRAPPRIQHDPRACAPVVCEHCRRGRVGALSWRPVQAHVFPLYLCEPVG